jgi:GYF domain 2
MESVWYYARDGAQTGPVSFDDLKKAIGAGQIGPEDLVWREGTPDWMPAKSVPGLFAEPSPIAPLPLAPPMASPSRHTGPAVMPRPKAPEPPLPIYDAPIPFDQRGPSAKDMVALAKEFLRRTSAANPSTIAPNAIEEDRLVQAGYDPIVRKFAVWRRAVLWVSVVPSAFAALFSVISIIDMEKEPKQLISGLGMLLLYLQAFALFALPVLGALAALAYDQLGKSTRFVLLGAAFSIGVPLFVALVPTEVMTEKPTDSEAVGNIALFGFGFRLQLYLALLPLILSVLPGAARSCVRLKMFLPESLVPGWVLVSSVPVFVLLTLAAVLQLYQFAGNFLLVLTVILWIGAPLLYLTKFKILTRPVTESQDLAALTKMQLYVLAAVGAGALTLVFYLTTTKLGGMTILGFDKSKSIIRPWSLSLHAMWLEYVGRSLFMTVLFADLLVRMAVMVWREERAFAGTPVAQAFDRNMSGLGASLETKGVPPVV